MSSPQTLSEKAKRICSARLALDEHLVVVEFITAFGSQRLWFGFLLGLCTGGILTALTLFLLRHA
jgi:hypothetical protein